MLFSAPFLPRVFIKLMNCTLCICIFREIKKNNLNESIPDIDLTAGLPR